jgi:hypothetical protein
MTIDELGTLVEAFSMMFSASLLLELKQSVADEEITEEKAEDLYGRVGQRFESAIDALDRRLAARAELTADQMDERTSRLIVLQHPEDHQPN